MLRSLIGRTAAEVARRRGIAAATVERIVASQWAEDRPIDPQRGITDSGREELSLKKRHRLDVTLLTQQVRTHRVDMGAAYPAACADRLKHSRAVTDRFHVAKKFNEVVDALRKN